MAKDSFDIVAAAGRPWTTPPSGTKVPAELRTMLRAMLEDRFALQARVSTKQVSVVALRVTPPDKLGPAIHPSSSECQRESADSSPATGALPRCPPPDMQAGVQMTAVTMPEVADVLSKIGSFRDLGPFTDQTGRAGLYDVSFSFKTWLPKLKWTRGRTARPSCRPTRRETATDDSPVPRADHREGEEAARRLTFQEKMAPTFVPFLCARSAFVVLFYLKCWFSRQTNSMMSWSGINVCAVRTVHGLV